MSSALAIAAVTAALRSLIETGIAADPSMAGVVVTTRPLDRARDSNANNQVNLFLYHTLLNSSWRNMDIPRTVHPGGFGPTPLPLNLFYLITAYHGSDEDGAIANGRLLGSSRLLGLVMSALHDHPVLDADLINASMPAADQADFPFQQVERVRITPHTLSIDELSKLWSSFQSEYRMSVAYEASVVLIESRRPKVTALPVLRRGANNEGVFVIPTASPVLTQIELPEGKPAAEFGDELTVHGVNLHSEGLTLQFHHRLVDTPLTVDPEPGRTTERLVVQLPDHGTVPAVPSTWAAGVYLLNASVTRPNLPAWTSSGLPFGLAPQITGRSPASAPAGNVSITVTCIPQIREGQQASLIFGDRQVDPDSITTPADPTAGTSLAFTVSDALPGSYPLRLRVEGVDSLPVDFLADPPEFDADQTITIT
jgi:hypothetical protein